MQIDEKVSKEQKYLKKSHSLIHIAREIEGFTYIKKAQKVFMLSVLIDLEYANEIFPHIKDLSSTKILKHANMPTISSSLSEEIFNFNPNSKIQMLYLQSKVLELIYHEFLPLEEKKTREYIVFSNYDKNALKKARDIIFSSNLQNPPSTKELSKMVHLNEFKLKFGFKKLYGTSIYQSILTCKMNSAKKMLKNNELNVSEVAKICGYNHISSFSQAFKRHFGINPKSISKEN